MSEHKKSRRNESKTHLGSDLVRVMEARHHDAFEVLGLHNVGTQDIVRVFLPGAREVSLEGLDITLERLEDTDFFQWQGEAGRVSCPYRLEGFPGCDPLRV